MDILILTAAVLAVTGLTLVVGIPTLESYRVFHTGVAVDAVVSERREKKGKIYLTWGYTIADTYYSYPAKHGSRKEERKEGDRGAVLLKKGNPWKVYELSNPDRRTVLYITGGLFITGAIIAVTA